MTRFWITLAVVAMAVVITIPAGAGDINCDDESLKPYTPDHPTCPTTTIPDTSTTTTTIPAVVECEFVELDNGILQLKNWWSEDQSAPYRCLWTTEAHGPFTFHLTASSADDDLTVLRPHMFVTDSHPYGDKCFDDMDNGWHDLPYAWEEFSLPADGECYDSFPEVDPDGPDVFSLLISARVKGVTPETEPVVTVK